MLKVLEIENIAVIEKAAVQFDTGLNVLTGETGAGKSIVVDAINTILGERTSRELVRHGAPQAVVRAFFEGGPCRAGCDRQFGSGTGGGRFAGALPTNFCRGQKQLQDQRCALYCDHAARSG